MPSYRKYVEMNLFSDKVRKAIGTTVPTTTEQIKFKYIRIDAAAVPTVTAAIKQRWLCAGVSTRSCPTRCRTAAASWRKRSRMGAARCHLDDDRVGSGDRAMRCSPRPSARRRASSRTPPTRPAYIGLIKAKGIEPLAADLLAASSGQRCRSLAAAAPQSDLPLDVGRSRSNQTVASQFSPA